MNEVKMNDDNENDNEMRNVSQVKRSENWQKLVQQTEVEIKWLVKEERFVFKVKLARGEGTRSRIRVNQSDEWFDAVKAGGVA